VSPTVLANDPRARGGPAPSKDAGANEGLTEAGRTPARSAGSGLTLGERLERVRADLDAEGVAECPVCGGRMLLSGHVARCTDCGSALT
jgi:hypothetical protein